MTKTITRSPRLKVEDYAEVLAAAKLRAVPQRNGHYGHYVEVPSPGPLAGRYIVTPAGHDQIKVRWYPSLGRTAVLGLVDTPARAAGLILDHQEGLLL
jgi:hypothetical protein